MTKRPTTTKRATTSTSKRQATKTTKDSPPTINTSKLPEQLKELRLPTFRETHLSTAEQAAREQWTHTQFLADLVEKECQARTQSRILRLMRNAHLLAGKT
jgi:DNA replication protein DnaC